MLGYEELTEPERAVWNAIETGALVTLPVGATTAEDSASGATWGQDRQIRAQLLYELLAGGNGPKDIRPRALKLAGARITGTLDLEAVTLVCPLSLVQCYFDQPINLKEAHAPAVHLSGCHVPGLDAEQFQTRGNLGLDGAFTATGEIRLLGAHIGGSLILAGAALTNPEGAALSADALTVDQAMFCHEGFTAAGEVRLVSAHIGTQLAFSGATLTNPGGVALGADGLTVDHAMFCDQGFTAEGEVRLPSAHIGGQLAFVGAMLTNPDGVALEADGLTVDQGMVCLDGFTAQGNISMIGAHIGGTLDFSGATLTKPKAIALEADGLSVDQDLFCREGFTAQGEVRLLGAHIGGQLDFSGATLTNPKAIALEADELTVDQGMACREGFTAQGMISLRVARIGGQLNFDSAALTNPEGIALGGDGLTVGQTMFCGDGFTAQGEIHLPGGHIHGQFNLHGATLANPDGAVLVADGLTVDQGMFCVEGFTAQGAITLRGAHIGGQLNFDGAKLTYPDGFALDLERFRGAILVLQPEVAPDGAVDLTHAHVDTYVDSQATWPQGLRLHGFTYGALVADPEVDARTRLGWLERDLDGYIPQVYEQLAAAYRSIGRNEDARKVAIAKQRRRRQTLNGPGRWWNSLLRWTVGYGYQTWKAGVWLLGLVGLGWWIFDRAYPTHLVAANPPGQRPSFHAGLYALDLLLPFADLGYQGAWIAAGWTRAFYLGWNLAGWVLITAVVAALSGLIKRD
jgi:hypothetical protein